MKTIIHTEIRRVLDVSYTEYSHYRQGCFDKWCQVYAYKKGLPKHFLLRHKGIYNWYCDQWNLVVENLFYIENKDYIESDVKDPPIYWNLFMDYPKAIHGYFPGILLSMLKKEYKKHMI